MGFGDCPHRVNPGDPVRLSRSTFVLALVALGASRAGAQRTFHTVGDDLRDAGSDMLYVWSAPARGDARDWAIAGAVAGVSVVAMTLDEHVDRAIVRDSMAPARHLL